MRISIWQQFSSNHSANFTVVGTFESQEKATTAAKELRDILDKIEMWWELLTPEERYDWGSQTETSTLTPPEFEFSNQYKVVWPFSINWFHWHWDRDVSFISVFRNFILINNPHYHIWKGPQPIDGLMTQLGGDVAVEVSESQSYPNTFLLLDLTCVALDELMAELIADEVNDYIHSNYEGAIPWLAYHNGSLDTQAKLLRKIERSDPDDKDIAYWKNSTWVHNAIFNSALNVDLLENFPALLMGVRRDKTQLQFSNLRFVNWIVGIQGLSAWLEALGCAEITYRFWDVKDTRPKYGE